MMQLSSEALVSEVREHSRRMVRELGMLDDKFNRLGYTTSQCHALFELQLHGSLQASEIAERLRLDPSSTSRMLGKLIHRGLVEEQASSGDKRTKPLRLTPAGVSVVDKLNKNVAGQVGSALELMSPDDRLRLVESLEKYAKALHRAQKARDYAIREIRPQDNKAVAEIIRTVMPEFGATGPGCSYNDAEVDAMAEAYSEEGARFYVVEKDGVISGCAGYAQLAGTTERDRVCELRKMYFLHELRGLGLGRVLLERILDDATVDGYEVCYLETLGNMPVARAMYESSGFVRIYEPMGATGHSFCDVWYSINLMERKSKKC